jgi:hypothetical protein
MWVRTLADVPAAALDVAENMREWDRREIFATHKAEDPAGLADMALACGPAHWASGIEEGRAIAVFGCLQMWPGVWSMWLYATDEFNKVGKSMTRLVRDAIVPELFKAGAHRLECRSMEGHVDAQRWLQVLGATREGTLRAFGRGREDFHVYVWPIPDVL